MGFSPRKNDLFSHSNAKSGYEWVWMNLSTESHVKLREYIMNGASFEGYDEYSDVDTLTFSEVAKAIFCIFCSAKRYEAYPQSINTFVDWCQGLPSALDTCYYYNRSAVEDLNRITSADSKMIDEFWLNGNEERAEKAISSFMYLEIINAFPEKGCVCWCCRDFVKEDKWCKDLGIHTRFIDYCSRFKSK